MKFIVNADDFGLSRAVNYGIFDAMTNGVVSSATLMVNMPGTLHAAELIHENKLSNIGVHLVLTSGRPMTNATSLTNENGDFRLSNRFASELDNGPKLDLDEVEAEWSAQIERFFDIAGHPHHFDSHHHIHMYEPLAPVVRHLAEKYSLPVRAGNRIGVSSVSDDFHDGFYQDAVSIDFFRKLYEQHKHKSGTIEIMSHPAYIDRTLQAYSSYQNERLAEFDVLTSHALKESGWFA
ncbi:chitin disaccharide deacetylase [Salisediminibacterium selenitireducens]|uniref:YdjC family protein n=1 Tax=Bacillus selenitireducens (strain ATCC 700615 / DSM 15326 / MLS10) TaxID=439292 RepID=D6XVV6_BACIE|nr:chitin disaccharide deacetylase [Salisediminibacterium selenitireducens]ADH97729.1 YdjC family protein [[Bacillus] selenitireducens MLS10]